MLKTKWNEMSEKKVLMPQKGVAANRFRYKDILAAQNHPRAIKFIRKMASR